MAELLSMIIIGENNAERTQVRNQLEASGKAVVVAESGDYARVPELVKQFKPTSALIILNREESLRLVRQLKADHPETVVICTGKECSVDFAVKSFRAGASEFLTQPFGQGEIKEVLNRITAAESDFRPMTIACFSSRGGCGLTTLSVNLAVTFARTFKKTTTLLDLNLQQGTVALFLGVQPDHSLLDVVQNWDRLDAQLLRDYHTQVSDISDNLYCLASPVNLEETFKVRPDHIQTLLPMLRDQFDYVVVDCQHLIDTLTLKALEQADVILLLTLPDLASVYNTKRTWEFLKKMGHGDKIRIVVNRYKKGSHLHLRPRKVEQVVGRKIDQVLPDDQKTDLLLAHDHLIDQLLTDDYETALSALQLGRPLVSSEPKSLLARQYVQLAGKITGRVATPKKEKKGWFSLFDRK